MPKNDALKLKRPRPTNLAPDVAQAVLEDAMLEAAADIAALSATLGVAAPHADAALPGGLPVPETPEEEEIMDLLGVPHLGPVRRQLLADAGIETLADLQALSFDGLANIKGVGLGNARRVKDWLASQPAPASPPAPGPAAPAPPPAAAPAAPAPDMPPSPPTVSGNVPDMSLASANQEIQDLFGRIDQATARLKASLLPSGGAERLERQLAKLDNAASELAEGPDTLSAKQLQKALKSLDKAASVLEAATGGSPLSAKKQDLLADTLKEQRKALEKALGG